MSPLLIILLVWLGSAMLVMMVGLYVSGRAGPVGYVVMKPVDRHETQSAEAADYREAA